METLDLSDALADIEAVLDRVVADKAPIAITRQRGEGVVVVAQSELDSIEETMCLMASPANAKRLLESIAELEAGNDTERQLIEP